MQKYDGHPWSSGGLTSTTGKGAAVLRPSCGFDSLETAQRFLGVSEKLYRFTPFSADAQARIRGKSPLELAGYDIRQIPMAWLCAGLSVDWPLETAQDHVLKP
jgi:hypothetical protein